MTNVGLTYLMKFKSVEQSTQKECWKFGFFGLGHACTKKTKKTA